MLMYRISFLALGLLTWVHTAHTMLPAVEPRNARNTQHTHTKHDVCSEHQKLPSLTPPKPPARDNDQALHAAVASGSVIGIIRALKDDARICSTNSHGQTVLHVAAAHDKTYAAKKLLAKPLVNAKDIRGDTPLIIAARNGAYGVALLLLGAVATADLHATNKAGESALHAAAAAGNHVILKNLCGHGGAVDARIPGSHDTALHRAARAGHTDAVKILLSHGATIQANGHGHTPYACALLNGHTQTIASFRAHAARQAHSRCNHCKQTIINKNDFDIARTDCMHFLCMECTVYLRGLSGVCPICKKPMYESLSGKQPSPDEIQPTKETKTPQTVAALRKRHRRPVPVAQRPQRYGTTFSPDERMARLVGHLSARELTRVGAHRTTPRHLRKSRTDGKLDSHRPTYSRPIYRHHEQKFA